MKNEKLTIEEYIKTKQHAYEIAATCPKEKIIELANQAYNMGDLKNKIFSSTLYFPNDWDIITTFHSNRDNVTVEANTHDPKYLSKILNIPEDVIRFKLMEYGIFRLLDILKSNPKLSQYAEQASQFDGSYERKI